MNNVSVSYNSPELKDTAMQFADQHGYACSAPEDISTPLVLNFTPEYTELRDREKHLDIHIDFTAGSLAHRQQYGGGRGQAIAKAIGLKQGVTPPTVVDATAGLAKDAFVLASLGCSLKLIERSPVIAELINDAISRAKDNPQFQAILQNGFEVISASSIEYLKQMADKAEVVCPDVIYLDPMYPERKKSASVKKNMQILQQLLGKDNDTEELLEVALNAAAKRVVVKRPKSAPPLSTKSKPTYQVSTKNTRYDVYIIQPAEPG